jgi:ABC-type sugar transport system ATPase subunit
MAGVTLDRISKHFARERAVDDVSLAIADGEFCVFVGPSGCGKTTVLRMIAGLEEPTSGRIAIGDRDVTDLAPGARDVAMVFQNYALYPHLDVFENIAFGLRVRRTPEPELRQRVTEAAELLEIGAYLKRKPGQLSGGQRQRVALARAIVRKPAAFLFDEPLSNLDAQIRAQTRAELVRLHRSLGATMIYVTHDQVEAMTMAGRVAVMHAGRLEQVAPPLELYARPATLFVAGFIGSPAINRLAGRVDRDGSASRFRGALDVAVRAPAMSKATLAIRPEHLTLVREGSGALATVSLVEPLGPESHVRLVLESGIEIVVRVPGQARVRLDERVGVQVDPAGALVFDAAGRLVSEGG